MHLMLIKINQVRDYFVLATVGPIRYFLLTDSIRAEMLLRHEMAKNLLYFMSFLFLILLSIPPQEKISDDWQNNRPL